jgi:hypothetical protein
MLDRASTFSISFSIDYDFIQSYSSVLCRCHLSVKSPFFKALLLTKIHTDGKYVHCNSDMDDSASGGNFVNLLHEMLLCLLFCKLPHFLCFRISREKNKNDKN